MTAPASPFSSPAPIRPTPGAPREYRFPRFERAVLANGVRIVVAPVAKLPVVTVTALIDAGAVCDPVGREGLAQLTAKLLAEDAAPAGTASLTDRFERLGTALETSADWDVAVLRLTVMTARLDEAIALLGEVLRRPAFPEREVERLKAERLAELLQLKTEPRGLADEMLSGFLYAPTSRFAKADGGTVTSVGAITRDDVQRFYTSRYQPGAVTLVFAGDVSAADAERLAERTLSAWEGTAPASVSASDAPARERRAVHIVTKAEAPQSELRLGHVGLPRRHPDYFDVTVMNALLGGLFSSRINLNLRERHGYTYGAHSVFAWRRDAGPFAVSTAVRTDVTDAAVRETLVEIDRMRSEPVPADELSLATSYLDGVFPIRYETTAAIAAGLANLVIYDLPDDYYDTYRPNIRAVTAERVLEAARRHVHPERLQIVVVGDPTIVRAPLESLDFGPTTVYDADGTAVAGDA